MSLARPVFMNVTLFVTRRVHGRQYRLRPSRKTNRIIAYLLAVVASECGLRIHAICVMSDHYHLVATDPDGNIVEFTRAFHSLVARHINASHGDFESLWSRQQTNRVALAEPTDTIGKIVYTMANPVAAYQVRHGRSWPGVRAAWPARPRRIKRPLGFLGHRGDGRHWPAEVVLELHRPPGFDDVGDAVLGARMAEAIEAREREIQAFADARGIRYAGARAVRRMSRRASARSREERFGLVPTLACKGAAVRVELLARRRAWLDAYAEALERWRAGDRDVVFPHGTYKMRVVHNVEVAPAPV